MNEYWLNPLALPLLLTAVAMVATGLVVLTRERSSAISISFFMLTATIGGWLGSVGAMMCTRSLPEAVFWAKFCYVAVPLIPAALYHFTTSFLHIEQHYRGRIAVNWAGAFIFAVIMAATNRMLDGVYEYSWGFFPRLRPLATLFILFFGISLVASLRHYMVERRRPQPPPQRLRVDSFFRAIMIGYAGSIDYLPAFGVAIYPFGFIAIGIFIILVARLLLRYHLVDYASAPATAQLRETIPAAVIVTDNQGEIQLANRVATAILGYQSDAFIGLPLAQVISPAAAELDSSDAVAMTWVRRDGSKVDVAVTTSALRDERDAPIGRVLVGVDVTELNVARNEVEQLSRRNALLLSAAGDGIYGVDINGIGTFVNPAAARMLGYEPGELIGKSQHDIIHSRRLDGTPYPLSECPVERSLRSGQTERSTDEPFWRRDGTAVEVDLISTPIVETGVVTGAVVTFNDLTQRKLAEEQRLLIAREQEANRAKDELLAVVAHDLRTPVASILGWVQLARSQTSNGVKLADALDTIEQSARMQARLVDDLFDIARISVGKLSVDRCPVDFQHAVEGVVEAARPLAEGAGITLNFERSQRGIVVDADGARLEQITWNLFSNALKFTPRGGTISMSTDQTDEQACLIVSDTGIGIDADFLPHVFDRYRQADRSAAGLGLGLAIIKHLVELHGGTIKVWSAGRGHGTTFTLLLPLRHGAR